MELRGYVKDVYDFEKIFEHLVEKNRAELISDSSKPFALPFLKEKTMSDDFTRKYQVRLPQAGILSPSRINARFWYKKSVNKASFKMSKQGTLLFFANLPYILDGQTEIFNAQMEKLEAVPEIEM